MKIIRHINCINSCQNYQIWYGRKTKFNKINKNIREITFKSNHNNNINNSNNSNNSNSNNNSYKYSSNNNKIKDKSKIIILVKWNKIQIWEIFKKMKMIQKKRKEKKNFFN